VTRRWGVLAVAALGAALLAGGPGGCTVNPATGEKVFTGGISGPQEQAEGRRLHPQVLRQFGPALENPALQRYVDSVGQLLARTAERRDLQYTFTVVDTDIVNAFAVPGGYIYITRGLLALFDSEAELAAVLGHELGHITALHYARGRGQAILAQLGVLAAGILAGQAAPGSGAERIVGELGGKAAFAYLRSFSRENEYESDDLGIRYLARAGYDTGAVARMLGKLRAHGRLEAALAGRSPDRIDRFDYTATHPAPLARIRRAAANAARTKPRDPMVAREIYLGKIDGMVYGGSRRQGFARGRDFIHPELRFRFSVPRRFIVHNMPQAVVANSRDGGRIIFRLQPRGASRSAAGFLRARWGSRFSIARIDEFTVNTMPAASTRFAARGRGGIVDIAVLAAGARGGKVYELVLVFPRKPGSRLEEAYRTVRRSLREMTAAEAATHRPRRIRVIRARRGDTQESLARRMAVERRRLERFRVLNGLGPGNRIAAGRSVKIVAE